MRRMYSENQLENKVKSVQKDINTLVDADGHERFINGDMTVSEYTGITFNYHKWSLSGSHLLIVLAGSMEANSTIPDNSLIARLNNVPEWVINKIYQISGTTVSMNSVLFYQQEYSATAKNINLRKDSGNLVIRNVSGAITFTDARTFRIAFDLLVD